MVNTKHKKKLIHQASVAVEEGSNVAPEENDLADVNFLNEKEYLKAKKGKNRLRGFLRGYKAFKSLSEEVKKDDEISDEEGVKLNGQIQHHKSSIDLITLDNTTLDFKAFSNKVKNVCLIEESPYYIHKIAQTERLDQFKRLYEEDPARLVLRDATKSWLPIHYAASKSKLKIIDFILDKSEQEMINVADPIGNTPLHVAIERGQKDCVLFLMDKGADSNRKNKDHHAPIHYCVMQNQPELLEILLSHPSKSVDIHLGGENGSTALHYCAFIDNLECAQVLINHKANFCRPCQNGFFPVHTAAQNCSNRVLEFLLAEGTKQGCSKLRMLSFVDGDNNKPLHAAVQFSNLGAVKLCLDNGASIEEVIEIDNSTPLHIACAQGSLEILKLMYEKQTDTFQEVVHAQDSMLMTPLHKAAMFDHVDVIEFLLENGAYIDAQDKEKRSPLLLAASRNCVKSVCYLLSKDASIKIKDAKQRNILHLIIDLESCAVQNDLTELKPLGNSGNSVTCEVKTVSISSLEKIVFELIKREGYMELLNEKDVDGCTAMHYACRLGYVHCLKLLISHGSNISIKNKDKQSALHFAAKYGRYASCIQLLNSENYKNHVNEKDNNGMTPLHLASQNGHARVVQVLMQKGALIYKSFAGNNPFHEASLNGYTECMKIILNVDPNVLDSVNKSGDTALHLAAREGHANVVSFLLDNDAQMTENNEKMTFIDLAIKFKQQNVLLAIIAHDRWNEALDLSSHDYKTPFIGIIQLSSEVTQAVMERCVTNVASFDNKCDKTYAIHYNFKYLNWSEESVDATGKYEYSPMVPLVYLVKFGRTECLAHPLCERLLERKWTRYGLMMYGLTTFMYFIFLFSLTAIVVAHPSCIRNFVYYYDQDIFTLPELSNVTHPALEVCRKMATHSYYEFFKKNGLFELLSSIAIIFSFFNLMKEILQIRMERIEYFKNFQTYIQIVLYPLAICFVLPFLIRFNPFIHQLQWEIGTMVIFLAWFNLLLYMQRFYIFGIYVVMFTEILKTLFKVIFLFSILIIGFGLVFYILLGSSEDKANINPFISIVRTIIMMLGETDGLQSFVIPYTHDTLEFGTMSIFFLTLFIFLIPILLTNLLIGLAVGDIESVQRNARLKREAMQVQLHVDLEKKMPKRMLERVNEMEYVVDYGKKCTDMGFFHNLFCRMNTDGNMSEFSNITVGGGENGGDVYLMEMLKQKQRMNTIKNMMDKQTDLLRLIVRKMEIRSEAEDFEDDYDQYDKVPFHARKKNSSNGKDRKWSRTQMLLKKSQDLVNVNRALTSMKSVDKR